MPSTTSFRQGDVVLVPFPFTDLSAIKQRPALVLSPDRSNKVRPDLVVAAITSQIPTTPGDDEMLLSGNELKETGLPKPSIITINAMKSRFTQRRFCVPRRSSCAMCKPQQRGWADKKPAADLRHAIGQEQQIRDWERAFPR